MLNKILDEATSGDSLIVEHGGGSLEVAIDGDFGSATVLLSAKFAGMDDFVPFSQNGEEARWSFPLIKSFSTTRACQVKLSIVGTAPGINAWI